MQSKGVVRFFVIALTLVCLYQYLLILPTNNVENDARRYAHDMVGKNPQLSWNSYYQSYLDSMSSETVLNLWPLKKFNYAELKKSQLALGLDLKGGMSVLLQVDLQDFLKSLSGNNPDPAFQQALVKATELQKTQQTDYVTLFAQAWKETSGGKPLAPVFAKNESLKGKINFDTPDAEVTRAIRELANGTVDQTYKRLKERIDKFGVVQPNVSLDAARDLILVELPGIDNPERARSMLQRSAKLEFWETYRYGDPGIKDGFIAADLKLAALASNDTTANATQMVKDTSYVYPNGPDGQPDTTKPKEMRITDRPANADMKKGPLLTLMAMSGYDQSAVLAYADKNKMKTISDYLSRPEVKQLFPGDVEFRWSMKSVQETGEEAGGTTGKYELYGVRKFRNSDKPRLDGSVVTNASAQPDPTTGDVGVSLSMNNEGARTWAEMTTVAAQNGNREIAIVLDDEVASAPRVINPIEGGVSSITGNFTLEEAQDLANILQVGKLPAGTHIVQESQVGPSLGADNINKSLMTMLLSVALLCAFMYGYYNKGGIVAVVALLANIFFILGTLASMGTVLTLPGIAGIVLTLAAAVDANVIIYERIREEIRAGLPTAKAIREGFVHALPSIIDANVTTLLTAVVLVYFGLGPIKGFGTVLTVGIFTTMFTAVLMGRYFTDWWSNRTEMSYSFPWTEKWLVGIDIDWMGKRKIAYLFSAIIIGIGIFAMVTRGFELGVDFKGGYSFNVQFDRPVDAEQLRGPLTQAFGGANPIIKSVSTNNTLNITTAYGIDDRSGTAMDNVIAKLHEGLKAGGVDVPLSELKKTDSAGTHIISSSQVTALVADDIRASSYKAAAWALAAIFLYLLIRFRRWQFSLGAVLSLAHDVLITLGFFALLHGIVPFSLEIDQAIIACILTVIGFSVNDTVIVYDRIREFINLYTGRPKQEVFNAAINTTLSRTLITSGTVIFVVLLLFLFGGSAIKGFAFGMLVGMVFGTYSSVFVASALVVDLTREEVLAGKAVEAAPAKEAEAPAKASKKAAAK